MYGGKIMANIEEINGKRYLKLECKASLQAVGSGCGLIWLPIDDLQEALFGRSGPLIVTINPEDLNFVLDRNKCGGDIDGTQV